MVDAESVHWWWAGPVDGMTRWRGVGRLPARLMYAGWDRRSALRRKVPRTSHAPGITWGHRTAGDRPCSGGAPAHRGGHDHHGADHCGDRLRLGMLSNHLGPQEAGQFAGDCDDHQLLGVLAGVQAAEPSTQPQLGGPGPGDGLGWQALLAAAQFQGRLGRCW
jgi:hypothetical protein